MLQSTVNAVRHAVHVFATQPWLILLSSLLDVLFLFVYGFVTAFPRNDLIVNGLNLASAISQVLQTAASRYEVPTLTQVLFDPVAKPHLFGVIMWLLALFIASFLVYVIFQAAVWKLAGLPRKWTAHFVQFVQVNLVWLSLLGLLRVVLMIVDLRNTMAQALTDIPASPVLHYVVLVVMALVAYMMIISYGMLANHSWWNAIKHAIKHAFTLRVLTPCLALLVCFALVNFSLRWVLLSSETFGVLLSAVVVFPLIYFARLYIVNAVSHVR